jgi:hypothetical protein
MSVTRKTPPSTPWIFLMFRLPARRASLRVSVWRKLQKYGALAWKNSAYILPRSPANFEKFQWLAAEVRKARGEAWVVEVARIGGWSDKKIIGLFNEARSHDYDRLVRDIGLALRPTGRNIRRHSLARLNRRLGELVAMDPFGCPRRKEAEEALKELEARLRRTRSAPPEPGGRQRAGFRRRVWMTRPRPEVDRVASAWLIRQFIDPGARFVFSPDPDAHPGAVRFDMFEGEFTHLGDSCTFEVLLERFELSDKRLRRISQIVHEADLEDNKFGRPEGRLLDLIFKGWAKMGWPDEEILKQGFKLYEALYRTLEA